MEKTINKLNSLIKKELGRIILRDVDFSEGVGALVTLTRVETTSDRIEAKVYVSVLPVFRTKGILTVLNKLIFSLQAKLNKRLLIRPVPKIRFLAEDRSIEADRVERILEEVKEDLKN